MQMSQPYSLLAPRFLKAARSLSEPCPNTAIISKMVWERATISAKHIYHLYTDLTSKEKKSKQGLLKILIAQPNVWGITVAQRLDEGKQEAQNMNMRVHCVQEMVADEQRCQQQQGKGQQSQLLEKIHEVLCEQGKREEKPPSLRGWQALKRTNQANWRGCPKSTWQN